jgi:transcriptional regulator NrdR family protein
MLTIKLVCHLFFSLFEPQVEEKELSLLHTKKKKKNFNSSKLKPESKKSCQTI